MARRCCEHPEDLPGENGRIRLAEMICSDMRRPPEFLGYRNCRRPFARIFTKTCQKHGRAGVGMRNMGKRHRRLVVNLSHSQFAILAMAAATGGRARTDFLGRGDAHRTVRVVVVDEAAWNLSSLLAERDPALGPRGRQSSSRTAVTIYWLGVTADRATIDHLEEPRRIGIAPVRRFSDRSNPTAVTAIFVLRAL